MLKKLLVLALALGLPMLTACRTAAIERREDNLAAAGFVVKPADTPERIAMLKRLPPNRFVLRTKNNTVHYVYADPLVCGCLYVGTQQAYNQYKRDRMEQRIADEQQMAADSYNDAAWNWGAWGPGPWAPGIGFYYGPGFGW